MAKVSQATNPFYALLLVAGVVFAITACAYFVMALRGTQPGSPLPAHGLMALLDEHGLAILASELGVLSLATLGAMTTDEYWTRRGKREQKRREEEACDQTDDASRLSQPSDPSGPCNS